MFRKAFTLIELLVVISIVALLASVVLASLNSARDKGRIGSAKYFAAQIDHIASDSAVGIWNFDECGGVPVDSSGNANTSSFIGAPQYSPDTPFGVGCSLDIALGQGLSIPDSYVLDIGLGSATRSFWFKTLSSGNSIYRKSDASNANGINIGVVGNGQVTCSVNSAVASVGQGSVSLGYNNGLWHHLACVFDRSANFLSIYVDGTFQGKNSSSAIVGTDDLNATSAAIFPSGYADMAMKLDGVHFFAKALTASEVGKIYAEEKSIRFADNVK